MLNFKGINMKEEEIQIAAWLSKQLKEIQANHPNLDPETQNKINRGQKAVDKIIDATLDELI
jgi:predicted transcriptional regulator